MSSPSYRPDIDGLRALAVVPVVLFHAAVPGFSGGYVGVDVFFVISGFLITQIIAREIDEGRFSLAGFYVRRIRRIFPALMVMLAATLAAGALLLVPEDYDKLGDTTVAALLSVSNIFFYLQSGYFDDDAVLKPLLHTWSLAVEEQFYLYLPLLLLAMKSARPASRRLAVALIAIGSFALAAYAVQAHQSFAFYRLPTRAWELLAGSLLALGAVPQLRWAPAREAVATAGVALILIPVALFSENTTFPGAGALMPVLGTAAIIHCAPGTRVGALLGLAPLRGIGQISYSLYLWHWPIIVFTVYYAPAPLTPALSGGVIAASVAAAVLSWRFVERPFRTGGRPRPSVVFGAAAAAMAVIGGAAAAVTAGGGLPGRFPIDLSPYSAAAAISPARERCHLGSVRQSELPEPCKLGDPTKDASIAVWADSHGVELSYALGEQAGRDGRALLEFTASTCPPSLGRLVEVRRRGCLRHNRQVLAYLEARPAIRTVVLMAYYSANYSLKGRKYDRSLIAIVKKLRAAGRTVVVVGPMPPQSFDVPRRLMMAAAFGRPQPQGISRKSFRERNRDGLKLVENLPRYGAKVVFPHRLFCGKHSCPVIRDGKMLYFDKHHPSLDAARFIAAEVMAALKAEGAPQTSLLKGPPARSP